MCVGGVSDTLRTARGGWERNHLSLRRLRDWRQESPGLRARDGKDTRTEVVQQAAWPGLDPAAEGQLTDTGAHREKEGAGGQLAAFRGSGGGRGPGKAPGQDWEVLVIDWRGYRMSSKPVSPRGLFLRAAQSAPLRSQCKRAGGGVPASLLLETCQQMGWPPQFRPAATPLLQVTFQWSTLNELTHVQHCADK